MSDENPLLDGTLSIKVDGVEYAAHAGALQYGTVGPGGFGAASFEIYPDDPFGVPADFPELVNEAEVAVKHGGTTPFSATGGAVTTDGLYTVHEFDADDTLECTGSIDAEVLVVAGGGGGGGGTGGGGGGGGVIATAAVLTGTMPVVVGDGGPGGAGSTASGANGDDSTFAGLTSVGGGGGGKNAADGIAGGSGGGGSFSSHPGGSPTSGQGYAGGTGGASSGKYVAGGGGGAAAAGVNGADPVAGNGGDGISSDLVHRTTNVGYAGGGGGGTFGGGSLGTGGYGGGGNSGAAGTANTGGGGGGAHDNGVVPYDGGSGIVVVRYLTPIPQVTLYEGHIVGDPTIAKLENGESLITVECGGLLDEAKYRQDYGATAVDTTYDNWQRHRVSDKGFTDTIDGMLRFDTSEGQTFSVGDAAGFIYRVNQGIVTSPDDTGQCLDFEYDLLLGGVRWHCDIWAAPYYVDTLDDADWTTGLWPKSNTTAAGSAHVTGLPAGTRCVAFVMWDTAGGVTAAKHHAEITNLRLNCWDAGGAAPTVDEAMVACGVVTGLATASDTETIGNPLAQCLIPPSTTRADGLDKLASMYEAPVDWGFLDNATLRVKKRLNAPADNAAIRALAGAGTAQAAYLLDAATPAIDYDVHKYEEGKFDFVRAIFTGSRTNRVPTPSPSGSTWPTDWGRYDVTYVTALSDRFKLALGGAHSNLQALWPVSGEYVVLTPDVYGVGCRIPITATVPTGTDVTVTATVTYYDETGSYIGYQDIASATYVGPVTGADYILQGTANVMAGVVKAIFTVTAILTSGSGLTTVLFGPVDFHDALPGGTLRTVCAPSEPAADANLKVGTLDLTGRGDMTVDRAFGTAMQALAWIDSTLETGTIEVFSPTVPIYGGGTKNAAYVRAGDWVECAQVDGHAPLWISGSHVDVDEGVTTLTIEPYPFDVAESDFGHENMRALRRWKKARRGLWRKQRRALRRAQAKWRKAHPHARHQKHYI